VSRSSSRARISRDKLVGVLVALACLAFSAIGLKVNDPPDFTYVDGVRGQTLSIEQADLIVGDVEVGTRLVDRGEVQAETRGMFVLVRARLEVPGPRKVYLNSAHLLTDDRTYNQWTSNSLSADPGFAQEQELVFEVDPAQIDDLSLEIWASSTVHGFYQRARVHLGITAENAEQWRLAARGREVEPDGSDTTEALP
jgi:hypothetical protein